MRAAAAFLLCLAPGCVCTGLGTGSGQKDAGASLAPIAEPSGDEVAVDLLHEADSCQVWHRGVLLDLGSPAEDGRYGFGMTAPPNIVRVEREGATWARVDSKTLSQRFVLDQGGPLFVQVRIRGGSARAATVMLDDKSVGTIRFRRGESSVVSTPVTAEPVPAGSHRVSLNFHGPRKGGGLAEVDWIRIGVPDEDPSTYAAPTMRDLVVDTPLGGTPHRAMAMRAPGGMRCEVAIREGMQLRTVLGYTGSGEGEAEILLHEPGRPAAVLQTAKVGGESESVVAVDLPLDSFAGRVVGIELVATRSSPGGRVLFGEPTLRLPRASLPPREPARVAIVIVLSGASTSHVPPYAELPALASLTDLATSSATFRSHRTTTSLDAGSVASLLTGLPPSVHTVLDPGARLPATLPTLATMAHTGRVTSALFTANPTTFEAFGFRRDWNQFVSFSPVSGNAQGGAMSEATRWIEKHLEESRDGQFLAVVHSRGVHPPWAASAEEIRAMPPQEYAGPVEGRRGGQILAHLRSKKGMSHFKPTDRERIDAFCSLAMLGEDRALTQLVASLRRAKVWDRTLLVVTSDVAMGSPSRIPFGDGEKLGEDLLALPLVIHFPGDRFAGKSIASPTSPIDLVRTVLGALHLAPPDTTQGRDLFEVATHPGRYPIEPQIAVIGASYATRFGDALLWGTSPRPPSLCDLNATTACADDLGIAQPFLSAMLWHATYAHFRDAAVILRPPPQREPATLDPDTVAALTVWGNLETK